MGSNRRWPGQNISCYREQNDGRTNREVSVSQVRAKLAQRRRLVRREAEPFGSAPRALVQKFILAVCTENFKPDVVVVKSAEDGL